MSLAKFNWECKYSSFC